MGRGLAKRFLGRDLLSANFAGLGRHSAGHEEPNQAVGIAIDLDGLRRFVGGPERALEVANQGCAGPLRWKK
jgi:hypothetical protein